MCVQRYAKKDERTKTIDLKTEDEKFFHNTHIAVLSFKNNFSD